MRILLTGATGFLGSSLAKTLHSEGHELIILKRRTSSLRRIEPITRDIVMYDLEGLDFSVPFGMHGRVDTVIHTATCYGRGGELPDQIFETNTKLPLKLLQAASVSGTDVFINSDTSLDKDLNAYSLSKKQFAEWGRFYSDRHGIQFLNLRLEHFYGPGDDKSKFTTHVIMRCLENAPELKLTLGEQKRDFIYIDDVVSAYLAVLAGREVFSERFVEMDVGSGAVVTIREFVETVWRLSGSRTKLAFGAVPYRQGEVMFAQADISSLRALGWEASHSLEQGLKLTMEGIGV